MRPTVRRPIASLALFVVLLTGLAAGCGTEIVAGSQQAGQTCSASADCAAGLVCHERRCLPGDFRRAADAGPGDADPDTAGPDDDTDQDGFVDTPPACRPGGGRCVGPTTVTVCQEGRLVEQECPVGEVCQDDECRVVEQCEDADGDGYGEDCPAGPDCNEDDPAVTPGADEDSATPVDDNCNDRVNEECSECCPGGCGPNQFCDSCSCTNYDPNTCRSQYQPCAREGQNNGFFCADIGEGQLRCVGVCDKDLDEPADSCPTPNSACVFGDDDQGLCLNGCTLDQGCGTEGFGCLPYDGKREGICVPTNDDNEVGDSCNANATFDCETGAICAGGQRGQGTCLATCRPFAEPNETDCSGGDYCMPVSPQLGICTADNGRSEGESCMQRNTVCGEDAVGCFPLGGGGGNRCLRLCRPDQGGADCPNSNNCREVQQTDGLGVCL